MFGIEKLPFPVKVLVTLVLFTLTIVYLVKYLNSPKDVHGRRLSEDELGTDEVTLTSLVILFIVSMIAMWLVSDPAMDARMRANRDTYNAAYNQPQRPQFQDLNQVELAPLMPVRADSGDSNLSTRTAVRPVGRGRRAGWNVGGREF